MRVWDATYERLIGIWSQANPYLSPSNTCDIMKFLKLIKIQNLIIFNEMSNVNVIILHVSTLGTLRYSCYKDN